jgi:hypothetical protein
MNDLQRYLADEAVEDYNEGRCSRRAGGVGRNTGVVREVSEGCLSVYLPGRPVMVARCAAIRLNA